MEVSKDFQEWGIVDSVISDIRMILSQKRFQDNPPRKKTGANQNACNRVDVFHSIEEEMRVSLNICNL